MKQQSSENRGSREFHAKNFFLCSPPWSEILCIFFIVLIVESFVVFYWVCYGCVSLFRFVTFRPKPELLEDELTGHVSIRTAFYFYFLTAVYLEMILGDNKKAVKHE